MATRYSRATLHRHIVTIMDETGTDDPFAAIREKSHACIEKYHRTFGETPPFNMPAFASLCGLLWSDDDPRYSADSEIAPEEDGRVILRLNRSRPLTRQRFSIGHEVGHTLFPDYHLKVNCRKAEDRAFADPDDLLETLCDTAASEFLFPFPWFHDCVRTSTPAAVAIAQLAKEYQSSREATVRRFVDVHPDPMAAVFFSWKLKPTERRRHERNRRHIPLFEGGLSEPERRLRVDYAITNDAFDRRCTNHIPKDKSVPSEGPIYEASTTQLCRDGESWLDLGSVQSRFVIHTLPLYTRPETVGPSGACSVVAVITPK
jgi:IrrE N-terminal-like domain